MTASSYCKARAGIVEDYFVGSVSKLISLLHGFLIALISRKCNCCNSCTGWLDWMSHRKRRETKQQLSWWPLLALLSCCLFSLSISCATSYQVALYCNTLLLMMFFPGFSCLHCNNYSLFLIITLLYLSPGKSSVERRDDGRTTRRLVVRPEERRPHSLQVAFWDPMGVLDRKREENGEGRGGKEPVEIWQCFGFLYSWFFTQHCLINQLYNSQKLTNLYLQSL